MQSNDEEDVLLSDEESYTGMEDYDTGRDPDSWYTDDDDFIDVNGPDLDVDDLDEDDD